MNRVFGLMGLLAVAVIIAGASVRAEDKDEAVVTSKIMKACFGKGGCCGATIAAGKKEDWETAAAKAKIFVETIENLPKGEPAKGDKAAFEKQAKAFVTKVKALATATEKKDKGAFDKAVKAVQSSCGACHKAHK